MEKKFNILINIGDHPGLAQAKITVTESEYELLCNLAKTINNPRQPGYTPYMEVKRVPATNYNIF